MRQDFRDFVGMALYCLIWGFIAWGIGSCCNQHGRPAVIWDTPDLDNLPDPDRGG